MFAKHHPVVNTPEIFTSIRDCLHYHLLADIPAYYAGIANRGPDSSLSDSEGIGRTLISITRAAPTQ
jgi:hypothetical protein